MSEATSPDNHFFFRTEGPRPTYPLGRTSLLAWGSGAASVGSRFTERQGLATGRLHLFLER